MFNSVQIKFEHIVQSKWSNFTCDFNLAIPSSLWTHSNIVASEATASTETCYYITAISSHDCARARQVKHLHRNVKRSAYLLYLNTTIHCARLLIYASMSSKQKVWKAASYPASRTIEPLSHGSTDDPTTKYRCPNVTIYMWHNGPYRLYITTSPEQ